MMITTTTTTTIIIIIVIKIIIWYRLPKVIIPYLKYMTLVQIYCTNGKLLVSLPYHNTSLT